MLVPRARTVPAELLMEQMFRQTELEVRLPLNLNVLDAEGVPRVMSLQQALQAFLDHRMVVLIRRSRFRLGKIEDRLEVLAGLPDRLPQPRRGDPHHPRGGRAQGGADEHLRAHRARRPRRSSTCACATCAASRSRRCSRSSGRSRPRRSELEALLAERDAAPRAAAGGDRGDRREVRRRPARPPPHEPRRDAGDRARGARGAGRARAGHRAVLAPGLDAACCAAISRTPPSSSTRRATARASCSGRDHRQARADQQRRPRLPPAGRPPARRPRPGRAAAPADRPRARRRAGHAGGAARGRQGAAGLQRRARLHRRGAGDRRPDADRQAGLQPRSGRAADDRACPPRATTSRSSAATASS